MRFADSIIFLIIIILFISSVKSNFFLIVFGSAIFMFFIFHLLSFSTLEILTSVIHYIIFNPIGFLILSIPVVIDTFYRVFKKIKQKKLKY